MTKAPAPWTWLVSGYDGLVHAFRRPGRTATFVEAACSHSVPFAKLARDHDGARCVACMLVVGDHLAGRHRTGAGF